MASIHPAARRLWEHWHHSVGTESYEEMLRKMANLAQHATRHAKEIVLPSEPDDNVSTANALITNVWS